MSSEHYDTLSEVLRYEYPPLGLGAIGKNLVIDCVVEAAGITKPYLLGQSRVKPLAAARAISAMLLRKHCDFSHHRAARALNRGGHSSCVSAITRRKDTNLPEEIELLRRSEELIRTRAPGLKVSMIDQPIADARADIDTSSIVYEIYTKRTPLRLRWVKRPKVIHYVQLSVLEQHTAQYGVFLCNRFPRLAETVQCMLLSKHAELNNQELGDLFKRKKDTIWESMRRLINRGEEAEADFYWKCERRLVKYWQEGRLDFNEATCETGSIN